MLETWTNNKGKEDIWSTLEVGLVVIMKDFTKEVVFKLRCEGWAALTRWWGEGKRPYLETINGGSLPLFFLLFLPSQFIIGVFWYDLKMYFKYKLIVTKHRTEVFSQYISWANQLFGQLRSLYHESQQLSCSPAMRTPVLLLLSPSLLLCRLFLLL